MGRSNEFESNVPVRAVPSARRQTDAQTSVFDSFVRAQYRGLVIFLKRRTATTQDAEDAAQESLTRMLRYHDSTPASAWPSLLYRIAINVAHDQHRFAQSHHASHHVSLQDHELSAPGPSPEEESVHAQQMLRLRTAIKALPPKCRQVYLLKRVHGMSHAEVAQQCGISVKTVEKHLATALKKLRQKVGPLAAGTFE